MYWFWCGEVDLAAVIWLTSSPGRHPVEWVPRVLPGHGCGAWRLEKLSAATAYVHVGSSKPLVHALGAGSLWWGMLLTLECLLLSLQRIQVPGIW